MIKRAWLYLIRKYKRSAVLMLLLFVVSSSIATGLSVWNSICAVTTEIEQSLGTSINLKVSPGIIQSTEYQISVKTKNGSNWNAYNGPKLNEKVILQILEQLDDISNYNAEEFQGIYLDNISLVAGFWNQQVFKEEDPYQQKINEMYQSVIEIQGNADTALNSKFRNGAFELIEGRHITHGDDHKALISDELAALNQLKIGDKIRMSTRAGMVGDPNVFEILGDVQEVEIIGIFHVNGYQPVGEWVFEDSITYNSIFTDLETTEQIQNDFNEAYYQDFYDDIRFENVTFFVDDPAQLPDILEQMQNLECINTQYYDIAIDDTMYKSTVDPLNSIRNLVVGLVLAIVLGCAVVLCIVFTMWVRSRRQEIAVYLSMGISKAAILGQFVLEAGLVALLAGVLSFAACQQVPDLIGNQMLASTIEAAQPEVKEPTREEIHQAAQSGTMNELFTYESSAYAGPEHIDFTFRAADFAILLLLELLLITAAICKAGWFIFELQPRQIMTTLR